MLWDFKFSGATLVAGEGRTTVCHTDKMYKKKINSTGVNSTCTNTQCDHDTDARTTQEVFTEGEFLYCFVLLPLWLFLFGFTKYLNSKCCAGNEAFNWETNHNEGYPVALFECETVAN